MTIHACSRSLHKLRVRKICIYPLAMSGYHHMPRHQVIFSYILAIHEWKLLVTIRYDQPKNQSEWPRIDDQWIGSHEWTSNLTQSGSMNNHSVPPGKDLLFQRVMKDYMYRLESKQGNYGDHQGLFRIQISLQLRGRFFSCWSSPNNCSPPYDCESSYGTNSRRTWPPLRSESIA